MAKKYIELEAAIMAIEKPKVTPGGVIFDALKKACQEEVRNLPAADVVEVVRCSECKHNTSSPHNPICEYGNRCYCGFFCADGERKDGDSNV